MSPPVHGDVLDRRTPDAAPERVSAELAVEAPVGGRVELGGPESIGVDAWARRLFAATGDERTVVGDPHALYYGTKLHGGELTTSDGARIGRTDFAMWFATHPEGAAR